MVRRRDVEAGLDPATGLSVALLLAEPGQARLRTGLSGAGRAVPFAGCAASSWLAAAGTTRAPSTGVVLGAVGDEDDGNAEEAAAWEVSGSADVRKVPRFNPSLVDGFAVAGLVGIGVGLRLAEGFVVRDAAALAANDTSSSLLSAAAGKGRLAGDGAARGCFGEIEPTAGDRDGEEAAEPADMEGCEEAPVPTPAAVAPEEAGAAESDTEVDDEEEVDADVLELTLLTAATSDDGATAAALGDAFD